MHDFVWGGGGQGGGARIDIGPLDTILTSRNYESVCVNYIYMILSLLFDAYVCVCKVQFGAIHVDLVHVGFPWLSVR